MTPLYTLTDVPVPGKFQSTWPAVTPPASTTWDEPILKSLETLIMKMSLGPPLRVSTFFTSVIEPTLITLSPPLPVRVIEPVMLLMVRVGANAA